MKRIIGFLTAAAVAASAVPVLAASGDIAGQYYSTNIHTYVNGYEIDSINICGQTLINAEDLDYYSFSVYWDDVARRLDIYKEAHETSGPPPVIKKSNYPSGMVLGNYYETDIVTYLDDKPITAYNTGGRTYIHAEQMRDWGYVVDWNEADRTLSITSPDRAGYEYTINLSEGSHPETDAFQDDGAGGFAISYENGKLTGCGDANLFGSLLSCDGTKYTISMGFYQNEGMFYSLNLQELLRSMCFYEEDRAQAETEENYARIDENVNIVINGHKAEKVRGMQWRGNGHVDFGFEITNIPIYKKDEIKSVYFSVGNTDGMEEYEIEKTEY